MTFSKKLLSAAVLVASSSIAMAATDTTNIEINVTKDAYVNLIGSALTTFADNDLSEAQVDNVTTSLGTLGAETNTVGGCTMTITSANSFRLQHDTDLSLYLHDTATYSVNHDLTTYASDCNQVATPISATFPALPGGVVQAGTYSDTLTVTVVTP